MIDPLFKKLVDIPSISGSESVFQQQVAAELRDCGEVKFEDTLNNYTVQVGNGPQKVMITAHSDEVGFIITYVSDDGFIFFQPVGGIDPDIAVGQVVSILTKTGPVPGIIARAEQWDTASAETSDDITPYKELWIDIGNNTHTSEIVSIGDPVVYDFSIKEIGNNYLLARGSDDKLGVFTVIKLIQSFAKTPNPNITLFGVTSTQEEVGSRGMQPAVFHIQPKYSIIIDTMVATDIPIGDREEIGQVSLGAGPVLSRGGNTNEDLFFLFKQFAEQSKISYQIEAEAGPTATDADTAQISGLGSATIVVSIPVRYTHFPAQVVCWSDVDNCIKLLQTFLSNIRE